MPFIKSRKLSAKQISADNFVQFATHCRRAAVDAAAVDAAVYSPDRIAPPTVKGVDNPARYKFNVTILINFAKTSCNKAENAVQLL